MGRDEEAIQLYSNQLNRLINATRSRLGAEFMYENYRVEIFYFRGKKGEAFSACSTGDVIKDGVNKKIPACSE